METLTVKNNKMDYSTYKKIIILFFSTKFKILFVATFCFGSIFLLRGLFMRDFSFCIIISVILLFEVIFNLAVSRALLKQLMKQQIERFNKDVIYEKMSKIASELEKMEKKPQEERNEAKEKELIYAQWMQGLKLNTLCSNRGFYF